MIVILPACGIVFSCFKLIVLAEIIRGKDGEVSTTGSAESIPSSSKVSDTRAASKTAIKRATKELKARRKDINEGFIRDASAIDNRQFQTIDEIISMLRNAVTTCENLSNVDFEKRSYKDLPKFKYGWIKVVTFECIEVPGYELMLQFYIRRDPKNVDTFFYGVFPHVKCVRKYSPEGFKGNRNNEEKADLKEFKNRLRQIGFL